MKDVTLTTLNVALHAETNDAIFVSTCNNVDEAVRVPKADLRHIEPRLHTDAFTITIALHTARDLGLM